MNKKVIGILLTVISFGLLIPGITLDIFELSLQTNVDAKLAQLSLKVLDQKRSIMGTVSNLFEKKRFFVAIMIFVFSVVIPFAKGLMVLFANTKAGAPNRKKLLTIVEKIGKWSMADVFVVAIFLAFLATTSSGVDYAKNVGLMGMQIPIKINSLMTSSLGPGFYCFVGYCFCSLIAMYFFDKEESVKSIES
jgi:paraquat-inducible protein A